MRDAPSSTAPHNAYTASNYERLIAQRREAAPAPVARREKLPAKVYGVMAITTALTFTTLTTGYELFFVTSPFA